MSGAVIPANQQQQQQQGSQDKSASSSQQDQLYSKLGSASRVVDDRINRDAKAGNVDLDAQLLSSEA